MTTSLLQAPTLVLASTPSSSRGVWHPGPFPVRAYALCIIAGAVPFGLLGGLGIWGGVDQ